MYLISLSMITYTVAKLHRRGSTSSCLRLNLHSGLEFHHQKFGFHGDALDVTLDQIFRVECRVCGNSVCPVVEIRELITGSVMFTGDFSAATSCLIPGFPTFLRIVSGFWYVLISNVRLQIVFYIFRQHPDCKTLWGIHSRLLVNHLQQAPDLHFLRCKLCLVDQPAVSLEFQIVQLILDMLDGSLRTDFICISISIEKDRPLVERTGRGVVADYAL